MDSWRLPRVEEISWVILTNYTHCSNFQMYPTMKKEGHTSSPPKGMDNSAAAGSTTPIWFVWQRAGDMLISFWMMQNSTCNYS